MGKTLALVAGLGLLGVMGLAFVGLSLSVPSPRVATPDRFHATAVPSTGPVVHTVFTHEGSRTVQRLDGRQVTIELVDTGRSAGSTLFTLAGMGLVALVLGAVYLVRSFQGGPRPTQETSAPGVHPGLQSLAAGLERMEVRLQSLETLVTEQAASRESS